MWVIKINVWKESSVPVLCASWERLGPGTVRAMPGVVWQQQEERPEFAGNTSALTSARS